MSTIENIRALVGALAAFLPIKEQLVAETDAALADGAPEELFDAWMNRDMSAFNALAQNVAEKATTVIEEICDKDPVTKNRIYSYIWHLRKVADVTIMERGLLSAYVLILNEWLKTKK